MKKRLTIFSMLLAVITLTGCSNQIKEAKAQEESWDKEWFDSCEKQWTNFECRLLYRAHDNADRATLLEGFRKDREFRSKK